MSTPPNPSTTARDSSIGSIKTLGRITVLYFAAAQTATDRYSEAIALDDVLAYSTAFSSSESASPPNTVPLSALAPYLSSLYPTSSATSLSSILASSAWSVNEEMIPEEDVEQTVLRKGDVVAVIPPVSGG